MKKKKTSRRRRSSVSGIKVQPIKGLLNLPTLGSAGVTAYGVGKMATEATGDEKALFRSKQGAQYMTIGGLAGAMLIPGTGLFGKIARGVALGMAAHGVVVIATGKDLAGNDVTADKMDAVAGYPYIPGDYARPGRTGSNAPRSANGKVVYV